MVSKDALQVRKVLTKVKEEGMAVWEKIILGQVFLAIMLIYLQSYFEDSRLSPKSQNAGGGVQVSVR